jgi:CelD/BcsL family acetyltransferase involved in cellulose biosynthesis
VCQRFIDNSLQSCPADGKSRDLVIVSQADHALLERPASTPAAASRAVRPVSPGDIALSLCEDIASLEPEWRRFETEADCTVFQSFDWLSLWQHHIGAPAGIRPAIVLGRDAAGELLFLVPLAVEPGAIRRLTFLGEALCDYNAPLLARGFAARLGAAETRDLWRAIRALLQSRAHLRHDVVALTKMPETIGDQANPLLHLDVALNPSGAHLTHLAHSWDAFYTAKRSSATRRRDRSKRKRLGEVRFVNPTDSHELRRTLETLIEQKTKSFARMGVQDLFTRPGHRDFYLDLATNPRTWSLVHVSRLDVGSTWAAINLGLRSRVGAPARSPAARDRARIPILRLHHWRRALQVRVVRHQGESVRPCGHRDPARMAGGVRGAHVPPPEARHQAKSRAVARVQRRARGARIVTERKQRRRRRCAAAGRSG